MHNHFVMVNVSLKKGVFMCLLSEQEILSLAYLSVDLTQGDLSISSMKNLMLCI